MSITYHCEKCDCWVCLMNKRLIAGGSNMSINDEPDIELEEENGAEDYYDLLEDEYNDSIREDYDWRNDF